MSGFPWGWLLISAGASLIYSDKVTEWLNRKRRTAELLAYLKENGAVEVTEEDLAYLGPNGTFVVSPIASKAVEHEDAPLTPAVSCSSSTPSGSEEEEEADDEEEDGVPSTDSADESE